MYKYQIINKLIDDYRIINKSLTQQDIADKIGISMTSLNVYKSGKTQPTVEMAEKIAKFFDKDMNYFFDVEEWKSMDIPSIASEQTPKYGADIKDKLFAQLEEQVAMLRSQNEDQAAMLTAFRTGAIKVVDTHLGNDQDGKCG